MTVEELLKSNEMTIEMINMKLGQHDISETNLEKRLESILGKEYVLAKELNKKNQKYKEEIIEFRSKRESVFENNSKISKTKELVASSYKYFDYEKHNNYFDVNEIYQKLSDVSIDDFEIILQKLELSDPFDIFLSHSMKDKRLVFGVYLILTEDFGKNVYIDWIVDPFLSDTRDKVALRNIRLLQIRMRQSRNLNLLKTSNYSVSKWVAWEIGYFNGKSNNLYILRIYDLEYDDDKSGMGFIKIYRDLTIVGNSLVFLDKGRLVELE